MRHTDAFAIGSVLFIAVTMPAMQGIRAEGFVDFHLGGAWTEDGSFKLSGGGLPPLSGSTQFDDSLTVGLRGGYWFGSLPWLGVAGEFSYFNPDGDAPLGTEIDVIPLSPLLMVRAPLLKARNFPHGRLQPYAGIGPGLFVTVIEEDTTDYTAAGIDVGLDVRGGVNIQILRWLALFAEYRFTSFEAEVDDDIFGLSVETEVDLDTHHVFAGVGFHF